MNIEPSRQEIQNIVNLPTPTKKNILLAAIGYIGLTILANAQLEVSLDRRQTYDTNKVFVGLTLVGGSLLAFVIEKLFRAFSHKTQ